MGTVIIILVLFGTLIVGLVLGAIVGRKLGKEQTTRDINEHLGSIKAEAERILNVARVQAQALLEEAKAKADSHLEEADKSSQKSKEDREREWERMQTSNQQILLKETARLQNKSQEESSRLQIQMQVEVEQFKKRLRNENKQLQQSIREDGLQFEKKLQNRETQFQQDRRHEEQRIARKEEALIKRDQVLNKRDQSLEKHDQSLERRSVDITRRETESQTRERELKLQSKDLKARALEIEERINEADERLQSIAGLTPEQARDTIISDMLGEAKIEASKRIKLFDEEVQEQAEKRAKRVIGIAIQRYAGEYSTERCVRTVMLPSDDMKGRIIGREGRNIRAIEAATGVDLIIDDTPEAVVISAFDPVRREIARLSLERLIADGRIHPTRIEEVVSKSTREIDQIIKEAGEQAAFELGLHGLHPEILRLIGRLRYRTSYGQNIWSHSIEVGWLCGMMAAELGLNVKVARRAGLLHDIGKAIDHEMEGSHAIIGADFCKKYGEKPLVVNAIASHHNEVPPESVIAHLVAAADALSGARPGARREILETYIQRLEELESISLSFEGVEKCYAIQAGREIRVIVNHSRIDDDRAHMLSREIARKIEQELTYPGQIKVTVIRETRATDFAR